MTIRKIGAADLCLFPDGTWCLFEDLGESGRTVGSDFEVVTPEDPRYDNITQEETQ